MALIKCPECGKEISSEAPFCPNCGLPIKKEPEPKQKKRESMTIAYRGNPGSIVGIIITGGVLGLIFLVGGIFLIALPGDEPMFAIVAIPMLILSFFLIIALIVYSSYFVKNKNLKDKNCIEYDGEKDKLVLCTLDGEIIEIDVKDYIELRDNFTTDNMLLFTYRDQNGQAKKVKLGYCANRDEIRKNIDKIRND